MKSSELRIQLNDDVIQRFHAAAKEQGRTSEDVLQELIQGFIAQSKSDYDAWFIQQVQIGIAEADSGQMVSNEEVEAEFASRRAKAFK